MDSVVGNKVEIFRFQKRNRIKIGTHFLNLKNIIWTLFHKQYETKCKHRPRKSNNHMSDLYLTTGQFLNIGCENTEMQYISIETGLQKKVLGVTKLNESS